MRPPIFIRSLSDTEKEQLETALRSKDAFVMRRAQIILASERGERASRIARSLGCGSQTARDAIHDFNGRGLDALEAGSSRPRRTRSAFDNFDNKAAESLREMLHRSPREFGRESSLWTLEMAAQVSFEEGLTDERVSGETIRATLARLLGVPTLSSWAEEGQPLRLIGQSVAKDDPYPKAVSCYGLYLPELDDTRLRFVDGRPVSGITTQFLGWCCGELEAVGRKVLLLIWDNASWHISKEVRRWLGKHNREVKKSGEGVRIVSCLLPKRSPWLNAIEPKWVHGKRKVVEPDGLLGAYELADRVCKVFGCPHYEHLSVPREVA